jgi:hypothetical protein
MRPHPFAAALAFCAAPALASNIQTPRATPVVAAACPMAYAQFEHLVPHLDMADCPSGLAAENRFCRLAVSAEQAVVFVFDYDTDCLVDSRVWEEDAFAVTLD